MLNRSLEPAGINSVMLRFHHPISQELNRRLHYLAQALRQHPHLHLTDIVTGYTTLLLEYDLLQIDHVRLCRALEPLITELLKSNLDTAATAAPPVEIPVLYSLDTGPDLPLLATHTGLSIEAVIACHSETVYRVYTLGFAPGFAYLGDLDPRLSLPRRATPRPRVPRGSVAIADRQTAVYPQTSPGGWHLLGRTPLRLFDAEREPPSLLQPGDSVRFVPIDRATYLQLGGDLND